MYNQVGILGLLLQTKEVFDKFKPIVKKSFTGFVNDIVNQKISSAPTPETDEPSAKSSYSVEPKSKIVTTEEELEAFYIVRGILETHLQNKSRHQK